MSKTKQIVRALAAERGYTFSGIADEVVQRGFGTRGEAIAALNNPVYSCCAFVPALERVLGLSREEVAAVHGTLIDEAEEEVRNWSKSV